MPGALSFDRVVCETRYVAYAAKRVFPMGRRFCSILPGVPAGEDERESVAAVPTSARSARQGCHLHTQTS